jgi:hypothetical protein
MLVPSPLDDVLVGDAEGLLAVRGDREDARGDQPVARELEQARVDHLADDRLERLAGLVAGQQAAGGSPSSPSRLKALIAASPGTGTASSQRAIRDDGLNSVIASVVVATSPSMTTSASTDRTSTGRHSGMICRRHPPLREDRLDLGDHPVGRDRAAVRVPLALGRGDRRHPRREARGEQQDRARVQ